MLYIITLLPVLVFLSVLVWLDSFSLVKRKLLLAAFGWGMVSVLIALYGNIWMGQLLPFPLLVAPLFEEMIKGLGIVFIIKQRRSAFFVDAALYGAAIGAGFSFLENIFYVRSFPDMLPGTAVVRGFGTSIMHCGTVVSTAVILSWFTYKKHATVRYYLLALIPAILLHTLYNWLLLPPMISLVAILFGVTLWIIMLFIWNEKNIGGWLDMELASEVEMLAMMKRGEFASSRAGKYMMSIREQFVSECFFDMYCYVQLYYELSMACKTNLMLAEAGFPPVKSQELADKVKEFRTLEKRIGPAARFTLSPLVKQDRLSAWKIESLM